MNEIGNKSFLASDKFMPEMHLKQPGFTCSAACGLFNRDKEMKNLCSQETQILLTKMSMTKPVFNRIWRMVNFNKKKS